MAFLLLTKSRILPFFAQTSHIHPLIPCFFSSTFMVDDYLITSCGFSPDKATRISKHIARLKSPQNPDSVLRFLSHQGFTEADIKRIISWRPNILCSSPEQSLHPNFLALRELGLSTTALIQLILSGPAALQISSYIPRVKFWMDFLGSDEAALVKAFKRNRGLVNHDIARNIAPKISLLESHGFSTHEIRLAVLTVTPFITARISMMEDLLKRAKEFGFQPGSGMFLVGLHAMSALTRDALQRKMELLMSFGWSKDGFLSSMRKAPVFIMLSEKNLEAKMDFFIKEVGYEASYIADRPLLLTFSLEKRLRPRHHVLQLLESKGLSRKRQTFLKVFKMSDREFVEKYILPHMTEVSGLHEDYLAACT